MFTITAIYAGALTFLYLALTVRVIRFRRAHKIDLGDADNKSLLKRMRAHSNFAEYAPIGIILLALCEAQGAPSNALHLLGGVLLIGRAAHAYGFSASPPVMKLRVAGMMLTLTMLGLSSLALLVHSLF
jgi:uncharacterized membrane protein YecN with MAPEG domain